MKPLWEAADFVRRVRRRLRFGELSRAPLRLLRLELREETAECEWMARPADPWDASLPASEAQRNRTLQALQDALDVRELIFETLSEIRTAKLRVYRLSGTGTAELVITAKVSREDQAPFRVSSVAMRAKLCGFHFSLEDGILEPLPIKEGNLEYASS